MRRRLVRAPAGRHGQMRRVAARPRRALLGGSSAHPPYTAVRPSRIGALDLRLLPRAERRHEAYRLGRRHFSRIDYGDATAHPPIRARPDHSHTRAHVLSLGEPHHATSDTPGATLSARDTTGFAHSADNHTTRSRSAATTRSPATLDDDSPHRSAHRYSPATRACAGDDGRNGARAHGPRHWRSGQPDVDERQQVLPLDVRRRVISFFINFLI